MAKEIEIPEGYEAKIEDNKVVFVEKENEDERVRKVLLRCCYDWDSGRSSCVAVEDVPAIRAYLEKQKDERELDFIEGKLEGVRQTCQEIKDAMSLFEPKDLTPFEFTFRDYIDSAIRYCLAGEGYQQYIKEWAADLLNLEKQKEQKPAEQLGGTFTSYDIAKTFTEGQNYVIAHPEKFGLCKPAEWSEENKEIMHDIIKYHYDQGEISSKHNKWASWLEHKYFNLQSNWKPSENKDVYEIAYERYPINNRLVREVTKDINEDTRDGFIDGYNYCNSTHWKPSKKQMEALEDAFRKDGGNEYRKVINSLYCDLQKLL